MIGTISIECNAKNPNFPLHPLRAYINSPSSLRIINVPKRIGKWCIDNVYFTVVYPNGEVKSKTCVLVGGVWTGTIEGCSISGISTNGYTVFADGTDENGNLITGYILGKGDVVVLDADGTLRPDAQRYYVRMLSAESQLPQEGDLYPTDSGYMIWQDGEAHQLGTPFSEIESYVASQVSAKADVSSLTGYVTFETMNESLSSKAEVSAMNASLSSKADKSSLANYAPLSTIHSDYIIDSNGNSISANLDCRYTLQLTEAWQCINEHSPAQNHVLYWNANANQFEYIDYKREMMTLKFNGTSLWTIYWTFWDLDNDDWQVGVTDYATGVANATYLNFEEALYMWSAIRPVQLNGTLATESYVDDCVAPKADVSALDGFATTSAMNAGLSSKADKSSLANYAPLSTIHSDYIIDSNGNSISANLDCRYTLQFTEAWQFIDEYSDEKDVLYWNASTNQFEYIVPEHQMMTLKFNGTNLWTFYFAYWDTLESRWSGATDYATGTANDTYLNFEEALYRWSAIRPVQLNGKLATRDQITRLESRISALEVRLSALEGGN